MSLSLPTSLEAMVDENGLAVAGLAFKLRLPMLLEAIRRWKVRNSDGEGAMLCGLLMRKTESIANKKQHVSCLRLDLDVMQYEGIVVVSV